MLTCLFFTPPGIVAALMGISTSNSHLKIRDLGEMGTSDIEDAL